jgi:hypothetical protein
VREFKRHQRRVDACGFCECESVCKFFVCAWCMCLKFQSRVLLSRLSVASGCVLHLTCLLRIIIL